MEQFERFFVLYYKGREETVRIDRLQVDFQNKPQQILQPNQTPKLQPTHRPPNTKPDRQTRIEWDINQSALRTKMPPTVQVNPLTLLLF